MRDRLADRLRRAVRRPRRAGRRPHRRRATATSAPAPASAAPQQPEPPRPEGAPDRAAGRRRPPDPHAAGSGSSRRSSTARSRSSRRSTARRPAAGRSSCWPATSSSWPTRPGSSRCSCGAASCPTPAACYLLPRIVGLHRAKELLFLGDDARRRRRRAHRASPTAWCRPPSSRPTVDELAAKLRVAADQGRRHDQVAGQPQLRVEPPAAFEDEAYAQELVTATADIAEGMAAFRGAPHPRVQGLVGVSTTLRTPPSSSLRGVPGGRRFLPPPRPPPSSLSSASETSAPQAPGSPRSQRFGFLCKRLFSCRGRRRGRSGSRGGRARCTPRGP